MRMGFRYTQGAFVGAATSPPYYCDPYYQPYDQQYARPYDRRFVEPYYERYRTYYRADYWRRWLQTDFAMGVGM
jgi:hypothetical protein